MTDGDWAGDLTRRTRIFLQQGEEPVPIAFVPLDDSVETVLCAKHPRDEWLGLLRAAIGPGNRDEFAFISAAHSRSLDLEATQAMLNQRSIAGLSGGDSMAVMTWLHRDGRVRAWACPYKVMPDDKIRQIGSFQEVTGKAEGMFHAWLADAFTDA